MVSSPFAVSGKGCISCCDSVLLLGAAKLPAAVTSASHKGARLGAVASSHTTLICHACKSCDANKLSSTSPRPRHSVTALLLQVAGELPTAVTIASHNDGVAARAQSLLSTHRFRCYRTHDVEGAGCLLHLCAPGACCTCCHLSATGPGTSRSSCLLHMPAAHAQCVIAAVNNGVAKRSCKGHSRYWAALASFTGLAGVTMSHSAGRFQLTQSQSGTVHHTGV